MEQAKIFGASAYSQKAIENKDPEITTAHNPMILDGDVALLKKIRQLQNC